MTIMNSASFIGLVEPQYAQAFDGLYQKLETQWDKLFEVQTAEETRWEEHSIFYGLGTAVEKPEGVEISFDAGGISRYVRFVHKVYALGFAVTEELASDGQAVKVGRVFSEYLARALWTSKEIYHADFFNNAFTTNLDDGVPLISASHPYALGGVWSNAQTTAMDLSEAALENLLIKIATVKDERGVHNIMIRPKRLIVPPSKKFVALRLLRSTLQAGTGNNDVNVIKAMNLLPAEPFELTRLTSTTAYFIQTDAPNGLIHKKRWPVARAMEGDFRTRNMQYVARERYSALPVDPRCLFGDAGL